MNNFRFTIIVLIISYSKLITINSVSECSEISKFLMLQFVLDVYCVTNTIISVSYTHLDVYKRQDKEMESETILDVNFYKE